MNRTSTLLHFLACAIVMALPFTLHAQTPVSGGIYTNTTWTLANSPYVMTGSIVVFPGVTLNIEPGVEVRVQETAQPGAEYYLEVRGTLNMIGTPGSRILFRADTALTQQAAWSGIRIKSNQGGSWNADYVSLSNAYFAFSYDGPTPGLQVFNDSEFKYNVYGVSIGTSLIADSCLFYGNGSAISGWTNFELTNCVFDSNAAAVPVYASSLIIDRCLFRNNGLAVNLASGAFTGISITNSNFLNNGTAFDNANNGIIRNCYFEGNQNALINTVQVTIDSSTFILNQLAVQAGFGTLIENCSINNNETGVAIGPLNFGQPMPNVVNNTICNNTAYNIDNRTDINTFIPTNCFCITDSTQLEAKILDGYDDITKGLVSYAIFDTSCSSVLAIVNKVQGTTGLEDGSAPKTIVFPNPAQGDVSISGLNGVVRVLLMDQTGRLVREQTIDPTFSSFSISEIPSGVYSIVSIRMDGSIDTVRLINY